MKIGFFTDVYHPQINGVSYSIDTFRLELEALGHEVFIFAPKPSLSYREANPHVIRFPAIKGLFFEDYLTSLFFPPQALRKIEKLELDIIHFHTPSQIGLLGVYFAKHHNLPLVTTYHTDLYNYVKHYPAVLPGIVVMSMIVPAIIKGGSEDYIRALSSIKPQRTIEGWNQRIIERGLTSIHNSSDLVIVPSVKMENQLRHWKTSTRIEILPTGVTKIPAGKSNEAWIQQKLRRDRGNQTVLFVGRLGEEKGLGLLISAFALVLKQQPTQLVIVGDGPDKAKLRKLSQKLGIGSYVTFVGKVERHTLGQFYDEATVFAFPSQTDTQGLVLNEAAAAGLPIVLVDKDVSVVSRIGSNALLAKASQKDLAVKLLTVLKNPQLRAEMSRQSVEISSEIEPRHQAEKLLRLYEQVIQNHNKKPKKSHKLRLFRSQG